MNPWTSPTFWAIVGASCLCIALWLEERRLNSRRISTTEFIQRLKKQRLGLK